MAEPRRDEEASLEEPLATIDKSFRDGTMRAFGVRKPEVLATFADLRTRQVSLFHSHMDLEMEFPNIEPDAHEFTQAKFCEHFTAAFDDQADSVHQLSSELEAITHQISELNRVLDAAHASSGPAPTPGAPPTDTPSETPPPRRSNSSS